MKMIYRIPYKYLTTINNIMLFTIRLLVVNHSLQEGVKSLSWFSNLNRMTTGWENLPPKPFVKVPTEFSVKAQI